MIKIRGLCRIIKNLLPSLTPITGIVALESIYFKIIGVSLVLTVSCGSKVWSVDQSTGKFLSEAFSGNRHGLTISSSLQNETPDQALALDYILYLIDLQSKKEASLNIVFNYCQKAGFEQPDRIATDISSGRASHPFSHFQLHQIPVNGFIRQHDEALIPSPSDYCKKPVRAGPFNA
ncbi:MAG: hypothetical protein ACWA6U_11015 [Breznakibacter sp.]